MLVYKILYVHAECFMMQIPELSTDICGNDQDPFPSDPDETHGTAVTGEIVGARSNGQCGTGIAYNAHVGSEFESSERERYNVRLLYFYSYITHKLGTQHTYNFA